MKLPTIEPLNVTREDLAALLERARQGPLNEADVGKLKAVIDTLGYADARILPPREQMREQCIKSLLEVIAHNHSVPYKDVVLARGCRDERWDLAVVVIFAIFYGLAARRLVRWIASRYDHEWWPTVIAIMATSLAVSALGVMLGELWSSLMESARFGWTGHMTRERALRIPWQYHRAGYFVAGVILFWLVAIVHQTGARLMARVGTHGPEHGGNRFLLSR